MAHERIEYVDALPISEVGQSYSYGLIGGGIIAEE